jgi:hypothetical protein
MNPIHGNPEITVSRAKFYAESWQYPNFTAVIEAMNVEIKGFA